MKRNVVNKNQCHQFLGGPVCFSGGAGINGEGVETTVLTGARTIDLNSDPQFLWLDPGGASRNVTLPKISNPFDDERKGLFYFIKNEADAAENLVILDAAASTIATLKRGECGLFIANGTTWKYVLIPYSADTGLWANAPSGLYPQHSYEFFDDFFEFDPTATTGRWVVVEDTAGNTQALSDDLAGGVLKLTNAATSDNDGSQVSLVSAPFLLAAGKDLWFEARVKCGAGATQVDVIVGLVALGEDLTGVADNRPADGIVFFKDDGATTVAFGSSKNGTDTGTNTDVGTMGTGWHTYGFFVSGLTSATPYFDGVADTAITATFCDDESLAPFFLVRNGDGTTTQTLEIDYVKVVQLR